LWLTTDIIVVAMLGAIMSAPLVAPTSGTAGRTSVMLRTAAFGRLWVVMIAGSRDPVPRAV
jgi:hypothetical protein